MRQRVAPGTYAEHLHVDGSSSIHQVANRDPQQHARDLPDDVFAFSYFDVGTDGILHDEDSLKRANRSKQYFVDAELFSYDIAKDLPGISNFTLERMRTLATPAMRYAGDRIRFYNPRWQAVVARH